MSANSLMEKLMSSYKQAILYLLVVFVYSIIGGIIAGIGFSQVFSAFDFTTFEFSSSQFYLGIVIAIIGYILVIVGVFAGFIFAGTRGLNATNPAGFVGAYIETFKLIIELGVALVAAVVFIILGGLIGGGFGGFIIFLGVFLMLLFPSASLFYVIEYLKAR